MNADPLVVGLDQSLTASGLAWPDGTVITHGRAGLTSRAKPLQERGAALMGLVVELGALIATRALPGVSDTPRWPVLVAMEGAMDVGTNIQAERCYTWWAMVNFLARVGVPVLDVPPTTVKMYATGTGGAHKEMVWAAVAEHFPQYEIHKTHKTTGAVLGGKDFDKADAVTLMAIGRDLLGAPLVELPQKHRRALDTLELPPGVRLP